MALKSRQLDELVYDTALDWFPLGSFERRALMNAAKDRLVQIGAWSTADEAPSKSPDRKPMGLANIDYSITRLKEKGLLRHIGRDNWCVEVGDVDDETRTQVIQARRGQGRFRAQLISLWEGKCCVTGLSILDMLIASHSKPWSRSSNKERLDQYNGLLLAAGHDRAFDKGYISFGNDGSILLSKRIEGHRSESIGVSSDQRIVEIQPEHRKYLEYHRENVFIREP